MVKVVSGQFTIERYPEYCAECPFFHLSEYVCHSERGEEGDCELGYMGNDDMRDFHGYTIFRKCRIKSNKNVKIESESSC